MAASGVLQSEDDWTKTDIYLKRPRTPNDPYSHMSEVQIENLKKKTETSPFFHTASQDGPTTLKAIGMWPPRPGVGGQGRFWKDRYVEEFDKSVVRGTSQKSTYCYIAPAAHNSYPEERHNTCHERAWVKWGPQKAGHKTLGQMQGQPVDQFTSIDLYRRHPTNIPGQTIMKYGRPHQGYYMQRNPNEATWFGSSCKLNQKVILPDIRPKSTVEYAQGQTAKEASEVARIMQDKWPLASEYTNKFLLHEGTQKELKGMERARQHATLGQQVQAEEEAAEAEAAKQAVLKAQQSAADAQFVPS